MLPLRSIIFLLGFIGLCGGSLVLPALGVANYMLIYQVFPERAWWGIAMEPLGIRYSLTAAACLAMGLLINLPRMPAVRPRLTAWDLAAIALTLVVVLSEFIGVPPSESSGFLRDKYLKMMVFIFCLTRITTTRRSFVIVLWTLVLGSLYIGYDAYTAPAGAFLKGRLEYIGGPDFHHSSGLAAHMAAMLPLLGVAFLSAPRWALRILVMISGAFTVNTIILCRTRSAFVGLLVGAGVAILFAPRRRRVRIYLLMILAGVCAYSLTDQPFWDRMATLTDRNALMEDSAASERLDIWRGARALINQYPWGVGIGNFQEMIGTVDDELRQRAAHNSFMLCWTELGTQGLALFVVILLLTVNQLRFCHRHAEETDDPMWTRYMAYGLLLALAISLSAQVFTERLYTEAFWWILALPGCLQRVVLREAAVRSWELEEPWLVEAEGGSLPRPLLSPGLAPGAFA